MDGRRQSDSKLTMVLIKIKLHSKVDPRRKSLQIHDISKSPNTLQISNTICNIQKYTTKMRNTLKDAHVDSHHRFLCGLIVFEVQL